MRTGCFQQKESRHGLIAYKAGDNYIIYMMKDSPLSATYERLQPCFKTDSKFVAQKLFADLESIEQEAFIAQYKAKSSMLETFYGCR